MDVYEFGPFQLDVERLLLSHEGEPVGLGPKVVETLLALVEHPGEVLAKPMLLDRIWPEGFVEEANLAQNIYVLRKTMRAMWGTDAIETVPRRGYRFTAAVQRIQRAALAEAPIVAPQSSTVPTPMRRRIAAFAGAFAMVAASFILIAGYARFHHDPRTVALSDNGARLYQIGRYYWNLRTRDGVHRSLRYFAQVVDSDPKSAEGYAGLADANAMMGDYGYGTQKSAIYFARARGYAEKALALDHRSAEAHAALGLIALDTDKTKPAMSELRHALALNPNYGPAHEWYGVALLVSGRINGGYAHLKRAADLDPLSVATSAWLADAAYLDRNFSDAIAYSRQTLELSPQRIDVWRTIGEAYEAEGNYTRAIDAFGRYSHACSECRAEADALLAYAYALSHRVADARMHLHYAQAHAKDVYPMDLAAAAAAVGERQLAINMLRKMHDRNAWTAIANDPRFDALREDASFRQLSQESA